MNWALLFLRLTVIGIAIAAPAMADPAKLHQTLPPDSNARNGEPQPLVQHKMGTPPPAALPGGGLHAHASEGLKRAYSGKSVDVLTYHYDGLRTGWNENETDLNPTNVASSDFGQIATLNVDGNVLAQPLLVSDFGMPDGQNHDVLVVATSHNSVYAFDAQNYALLWRVNEGTAQSTQDVGCADVQPQYGISSTPVIVRTGPSSATIYLVAATEGAPFSFHTKLRALDLRTGKNIMPAVEIAPKAKLPDGTIMHFDPQNQWSRAGLAYANGTIYVAIGAHCDQNPGNTSGWLLRYDANLNLLRAFHTIEATASYQLSGIWMSGFAPAVDGNGDVYLVTGNGNFGTQQFHRGYGECVLRLSGDLTKIVGRFTPANYQNLNETDGDLGSGGVMLLPTVGGQKSPPLAVAMGKSSILYLLNQNALGGLEGVGKGPIQQMNLSTPGVWGGPAYYQGPNGGLVYYQTSRNVLRAFSVNTDRPASLTNTVNGTSPAGFGGSIPIVSSNGGAAGTAVVWLVRRGATVQLEAYDALKLGDPIFQANAGSWSSSRGNSYLTAMEANGRVYVPAYKTVSVFGLTN